MSGFTIQMCQIQTKSPDLPLTLLRRVNAVTGDSAILSSGFRPPRQCFINIGDTLLFDLQGHFKNYIISGKSYSKGYLVEGSNGEYVYLTYEERIELVKKARELVPKDSGKIILAGSGCESTTATIDMSCKMAEAGADAVMVVTPCYYKNAMKGNFTQKKIADINYIRNIAFIFDMSSTFPGIDLSPTVVADLAQHENIIGMKESGGDITKIGTMLHQTKDADFQILAGSAGFLLTALQLGCVGGVCALANVLGEEVCRLQSLFEEGNIQEAVALQYRLIGPNSAVTKQLGVSGLKQSMDWLSLYGGPTRAPILPLTQQETLSLRSVFEKNGFL
ncbi:unnamed protein product, partial [Meganyctiphanes norvegica]